MSVLIVKNIVHEGPGTIEDFLKERGMPYRILNMYEPGEMPGVAQFTHLVIMGGPMAVYDIQRHPQFHIEAALIRSFIKDRKPVLGICLGAQLIAYALGADVYAGDAEEIGWYKVDIDPEGMKDPVLSSLSIDGQPVAEVFQWHGDTFDLPDNAVRLCTSGAFSNQAFRYRDNVYALQFHIEVTPEMIREWFAGRCGGEFDRMFRQSDSIYPAYLRRAMNFYDRFFRLTDIRTGN